MKRQKCTDQNEFHYVFLDSYFGWLGFQAWRRNVTEGVLHLKWQQQKSRALKRESEMRCQFSKVHDYSVAIGKSSSFKWLGRKVSLGQPHHPHWNLAKIWLHDKNGLFFWKWMNGGVAGQNTKMILIQLGFQLDKIYEKHRFTALANLI